MLKQVFIQFQTTKTWPFFSAVIKKKIKENEKKLIVVINNTNVYYDLINIRTENKTVMMIITKIKKREYTEFLNVFISLNSFFPAAATFFFLSWKIYQKCEMEKKITKVRHNRVSFRKFFFFTEKKSNWPFQILNIGKFIICFFFSKSVFKEFDPFGYFCFLLIF